MKLYTIQVGILQKEAKKNQAFKKKKCLMNKK